jgi:hypothetical protein
MRSTGAQNGGNSGGHQGLPNGHIRALHNACLDYGILPSEEGWNCKCMIVDAEPISAQFDIGL